MLLIAIWCLAYILSGDRLEWGDFSFFAQSYEAMRISIVEYGQFPWFNPWVAGGVPLYANPQMGVFSIQMLFTLPFGAPLGLKLAIIAYTFLGYWAMFLLSRRYFKISLPVASLISLIWVFSSFFVAHLPAHFTFVWYLLAPAYFYLALTIKDMRSGLLFGGAFAIMALSQIHNAFMHLMLICGIILLIRLIADKTSRKNVALAVLAAAVIFTIFAGHRFIMTYENVSDFSRPSDLITDTTPHPMGVVQGVILPLSHAHPISFLDYPKHPHVPHGFHEASATIGIFALIAVLFCWLFLLYKVYLSTGRWRHRLTALRPFKLPLAVFGVGFLFFLVALGEFASVAPYSLIKMLPGFGDMRVSTRWLLWFALGLLIFIGLMYERLPKKSFAKFAIFTLLVLGVLELFLLNAGYPTRLLNRDVVRAPLSTSSYQFEQTAYFGETRKLPGGGEIPDDGSMPDAYREYEATMYNLGVLYANDALVQLHLDPRRVPGEPTCPWEEGCEFVRSGNATVSYWSPQKIVLDRTAPGPIQLNMNNSNYFVINGQRASKIRVAEPFTNFIINEPDDVKTITIQVSPNPLTILK